MFGAHTSGFLSSELLIGTQNQPEFEFRESSNIKSGRNILQEIEIPVIPERPEVHEATHLEANETAQTASVDQIFWPKINQEKPPTRDSSIEHVGVLASSADKKNPKSQKPKPTEKAKQKA